MFRHRPATLGGIIYPIMFRQLQPRIGFAWATRAMGFPALGTFCVALPALHTYRDASKPPRSLIDRAACRELPFVIYLLALFVLYAGYFVPLFYIVEYTSANLHSSSDTAFYLLAAANAGAFIGRLLPGLCPKSFASIETLLITSLAAGIMVLAWI